MQRDFRAGFQIGLCYAKGLGAGFQIVLCYAKGFQGFQSVLCYAKGFQAGFQTVLCYAKGFQAGFQTVLCYAKGFQGRPPFSCVCALMENSAHRLSSPHGPLALQKRITLKVSIFPKFRGLNRIRKR